MKRSNLVGAIKASLKDPMSRFYLGKDPVFLNPGQTEFIHAAKIRAVQLSGEPAWSSLVSYKKEEQLCQRCAPVQYFNTLLHVISACVKNQHLMLLRHNSIVTLLVEGAKLGTKSHYRMDEDVTVAGSSNNERPDLQFSSSRSAPTRNNHNRDRMPGRVQ